MTKTNKNNAVKDEPVKKSGKGRPTPSSKQAKAAANAAASRKAANQWYMIIGAAVVIVIVAVILWSVLGDARPASELYSNNGLRTGQ